MRDTIFVMKMMRVMRELKNPGGSHQMVKKRGRYPETWWMRQDLLPLFKMAGHKEYLSYALVMAFIGYKLEKSAQCEQPMVLHPSFQC